jgi:hypothetical protein
VPVSDRVRQSRTTSDATLVRNVARVCTSDRVRAVVEDRTDADGAAQPWPAGVPVRAMVDSQAGVWREDLTGAVAQAATWTLGAGPRRARPLAGVADRRPSSARSTQSRVRDVTHHVINGLGQPQRPQRRHDPIR